MCKFSLFKFIATPINTINKRLNVFEMPHLQKANPRPTQIFIQIHKTEL